MNNNTNGTRTHKKLKQEYKIQEWVGHKCNLQVKRHTASGGDFSSRLGGTDEKSTQPTIIVKRFEHGPIKNIGGGGDKDSL